LNPILQRLLARCSTDINVERGRFECSVRQKYTGKYTGCQRRLPEQIVFVMVESVGKRRHNCNSCHHSDDGCGKERCAKNEEILTDDIRAAECRADGHNRCARVWQRQTTAEFGGEGICLQERFGLITNKYWRRSMGSAEPRARQGKRVQAFGIGVFAGALNQSFYQW